MLPLDVAGSHGPETNHQVILEMSRITKQFGPTRVLTEVDFALRRGEIHALMGENGAGKSTLMKIAAGLIEDFEGQIAVAGDPVHLNSPRAATRAGIAMIQQELSLVPELAVDENIFLGQEKRGGLFLVDRRRQIEAARAVLAPLDFQARIDRP